MVVPKRSWYRIEMKPNRFPASRALPFLGGCEKATAYCPASDTGGRQIDGMVPDRGMGEAMRRTADSRFDAMEPTERQLTGLVVHGLEWAILERSGESDWHCRS